MGRGCRIPCCPQYSIRDERGKLRFQRRNPKLRLTQSGIRFASLERADLEQRGMAVRSRSITVAEWLRIQGIDTNRKTGNSDRAKKLRRRARNVPSRRRLCRTET